LSKHDNDARTLEHDEDAKISEFSFLDNWSAEKQPTTNELLALHADADLSDLKSTSRYSVHTKTV
jgi:hypothetical protein